MEIKIGFEKNAFRFLDVEYEALKLAVTQTMVEVTQGLKADIRKDTLAAGLGQRMANTVRDKVYPDPKRQASAKAVGVVFSKAQYFGVFTQGAVIRATEGKFLAIPTDEAQGRYRGKRITPSNFPGKLRFVYRPGRPSLLVEDNLRAGTGKRKGFRRNSAQALKTGVGLATVVMFILLPMVRIGKMVDADGATQRWNAIMPGIFARHYEIAYTQLKKS